MKKLRRCAALVLVFALAFAGGCRDYRELEELLIVLAAAIDYEGEGELTLTAEVLRTAGESSGSETCTVRGKSIAGCEQELRRVLGGELYWGHAEALILSRAAFSNCITQTLDWALRDNETRLTVVMAVSDEPTAAELLAAGKNEESAGDALRNMFVAGAYPEAEKRGSAVRAANDLEGGKYALLPIIALSDAADYRADSGESAGGEENSGGGESLGGSENGKEKSGKESGNKSSEVQTTQRFMAAGAAVVTGAPIHIAESLTADEAVLVMLSEGKCGDSGYVIEGDKWTLIVESMQVREQNGTDELSGKCRAARLSEDCSSPADYAAAAREAAEVLEEKISAVLEKLAEATDSPQKTVRVKLTVSDIGLITN